MAEGRVVDQRLRGPAERLRCRSHHGLHGPLVGDVADEGTAPVAAATSSERLGAPPADRHASASLRRLLSEGPADAGAPVSRDQHAAAFDLHGGSLRRGREAARSASGSTAQRLTTAAQPRWSSCSSRS